MFLFEPYDNQLEFNDNIKLIYIKAWNMDINYQIIK